MAIEAVVVPIPYVPYVVLHTDVEKPRQPSEKVVVRQAMAIEVIESFVKQMFQP